MRDPAFQTRRKGIAPHGKMEDLLAGRPDEVHGFAPCDVLHRTQERRPLLARRWHPVMRREGPRETSQRKVQRVRADDPDSLSPEPTRKIERGRSPRPGEQHGANHEVEDGPDARRTRRRFMCGGDDDHGTTCSEGVRAPRRWHNSSTSCRTGSKAQFSEKETSQ